MSEPVDEEFTEIVEAAIPRLDLVSKGANGVPFLLAKSDEQAGILPAELVAELVKEADPGPATETVTLSGSPAAIARMIHQAPTRRNAPTPLAKETAVSEPVVKDDGGEAPVAVDDLIPDTQAGDPEASAPGSPEWEQLDGETAWQAISVLGRVKAAIEWLSNREATEAVTADPDDADNVWDLEGACCAIDNAISILAPFAAGEKLEAELAGEMDAVGKAVAGVAAPLAVLEQYGPVIKVGRPLSGVNEQAVRDAISLLQKVLASLPTTQTDGDAQGVAKSTEEVAMTADTQVAEAATTSPVEPAVKAKGDPVVIAYNAAGKAIGIIDPDDLQPISDDASAAASDDGSDSGSGDAPAPATADDTQADTSTPAPDQTVVPGTNTVQAPPDNTDDDTVAKMAAEFADALGEALAKQAAKQLEHNAELAAVVKGLQERVEKFGLTPDDRKSPTLNGATSAGVAERTAPAIDEAAELAKQAAEETDPQKKQELSFAAAFTAMKKMQTGNPRAAGTVPPANFAEVLSRFQQ